jgi:hypothetical protein
VQATQLGILFLLPNILLSGFMFPRDAMPDVARWIGASTLRRRWVIPNPQGLLRLLV